MKKSRLFMAAGALILGISAVFATKANKKFSNSLKTGLVPGHAGVFIYTAGHSANWLTTYSGNPAGSGIKAIITISTGGGLHIHTQLRTGSASGTTNKPLYLL
jgi:hypothetical protein